MQPGLEITNEREWTHNKGHPWLPYRDSSYGGTSSWQGISVEAAHHLQNSPRTHSELGGLAPAGPLSLEGEDRGKEWRREGR